MAARLKAPVNECENLVFQASGERRKRANIQKTLILLDFGNPELHNKLLAYRHPTWDDVRTSGKPR
jgi:hypothetical protein